MPKISLPPMFSTMFQPGPPSVAAQSTSQFLATVLATSGRRNSVSHRVGWSVSALETITLPSVTMDTDTGEVVVSDKRRTKLKLDSSPVSTTFAVFNSTTTTFPPCVIFTSLVETSSALS